MKRYLIYIAIIALGSLLFAPPPIGNEAAAATDKKSEVVVKASPDNSKKVATTAPQPVQQAQTAPQPSQPTFDPNNPSTWPKCADNQVVWASDGQCHDKVVTQTTTTYTAAAPAPTGSTVAGCGDNSYANYIYMHESGCSTYNPNPSSGACGLGQANPCGKLLAVCPNLDYDCENAFFTNYAVSRYGSWAGAYDFWVSNHWW